MIRYAFIILLLSALTGRAQDKSDCFMPETQKPDSFKLDKKDLFTITEYMETEYQVFTDGDNTLPANLSSVNYYVDINDKTDSTNISDINYLYLNGYHKKHVIEGDAFYLLSKKNIPMAKRNTNIRSSKTVDFYSELSSIVGMSFGYWKLDTLTSRIYIVFRDRTKIWNMENFRIFTGLVLGKNIYLTKGMNTKDSYLFDDNFKNNKEIFVKLPLNLNEVFHSEKVTNSDIQYYQKATRAKFEITEDKSKKVNTKQLVQEINSKKRDSIQQKINEQMLHEQLEQKKMTLLLQDTLKKEQNSFYAAIKYSYYPAIEKNYASRKIEHLNYDSLSFKLTRKNNKRGRKKFALFEAWRGKQVVYSRINISEYHNYYSIKNQKEFILIHVADPYDEKVFHTFRIPYSGQTILPRLISFFKKKIFDT
jgi:hypothetical protein